MRACLDYIVISSLIGFVVGTVHGWWQRGIVDKERPSAD